MSQDSGPVPSESRSGALIAVIIVFTTLIVVTGSLRLAGKGFSKLKLTVDDYFIIFTTALNIVANAFGIKACSSGFGRHAASLSLSQEIEALKYSQLAVGMAAIAYWAAKMSICLFIFQIIRDSNHRMFEKFLYVLMALVTVTGFINCLLWGLQASPFEAAWDFTLPGATRRPYLLLNCVYFNYAMNIFINLAYSLSPFYFLWGTLLNRKKKAAVFGLCGSGALIIVVSCFNIAYAHTFLDKSDPTWALVNEFICDIIERNVTVCIANLPGVWMLRGVLTRRYADYRDHSMSTNTSKSGKDGLDSQQSSARYITHPLESYSKQQVRNKDPWEHIASLNSIDDGYPLYNVSAERAPSLADENGVIGVQTDITVSRQQRVDVDVRHPSEMC